MRFENCNVLSQLPNRPKTVRQNWGRNNGTYHHYIYKMNYLTSVSILTDMKVTGLVLLTISITYTMTVGNWAARASVIIFPEADQVNTSICPGVSNITWSQEPLFLSTRFKTFKRKIRLKWLRQQSQHIQAASYLVKFSSKKIECCDDATIWTKSILLHNFFVIYGISNINVGWIRNLVARRIKVTNIRRPIPVIALVVKIKILRLKLWNILPAFWVQIWCDSLNKSSFSWSCHTQNDYTCRLGSVIYGLFRHFWDELKA